jgi:hypothetical protein
MTSPDDAARLRIAECEALAEKAYEAMYASRNPAAQYGDLKDYFAEAIGTAERAGMKAEAARLTTRLDHCREVYRSQFSGF